MENYLIWSNEHGAWWRSNRCGYTRYFSSAGRYTRDEAIQICADARGGWVEGCTPPEMPVSEADAIACGLTHPPVYDRPASTTAVSN